MTAPIGCAEAVRRLWEYLDDGLEASDHRDVEEHLAFCRRCCGELAFARELQGLLRTGTASTLPSEVRERLEGFIDGLEETIDESSGDGAHQ